MYSELLSDLYTHTPTAPESEETLVMVLRLCRQRLRRREIAAKHGLAEDLALELDHDRTLLRLCAYLDIEHDPARFITPLAERRRLEEELLRKGVDIGASGESELLDPNAWPAFRGSVRSAH